MKVLISDPLSEEGLKILEKRKIAFDCMSKVPPEELKKIIGGYLEFYTYTQLLTHPITGIISDLKDGVRHMMNG